MLGILLVILIVKSRKSGKNRKQANKTQDKK